MNTEFEVRRLFDTKADQWNDKYKAEGPLVDRMRRFVDEVEMLISEEGRILDFGCGTGALARKLAERNYRLAACDFSSNMIRHARRRGDGEVTWTDLPSDWIQLPYESNQFDAVVASSVFEYVEKLDRTIRELSRVLREGGYLVFTVPNIFHVVRQLEGMVAYFARRRLIRACCRYVPTLSEYVEYLNLSINRFSIRRWCRRVQRYGFEPVERRDCSNDCWRDASETLALLRFEQQ